MLTQQKIDKFYKDVEKLGLKKPVAAISKATKDSKGNVSKYLNRKLEPSDEFIDRFYEHFKSSTEVVPLEPKPEAQTYKPGTDYWLDRYVAALEKDKEKLFDSIHTNLIQVVAQAESLKFDVVSARRVLLDNVSLLRGLGQDDLRNEADNIKKSLIQAEIAHGKKAGNRKKRKRVT